MNVKEREKLASALGATLHRAATELEQLRAAVRDTAEEPAALTIGKLSEQFNVSEASVLEFVRTAGAVLGERSLSVQAARRAAPLAASEQAWQGEFDLLLSSAADQVRRPVPPSLRREELPAVERYPLWRGTPGAVRRRAGG